MRIVGESGLSLDDDLLAAVAWPPPVSQWADDTSAWVEEGEMPELWSLRGKPQTWDKSGTVSHQHRPVTAVVWHPAGLNEPLPGHWQASIKRSRDWDSEIDESEVFCADCGLTASELQG